MFIGLENDVVQLDLVSLMDKHFDPVFASGLGGKADRGSYLRGGVALALQEQAAEGETPLMKQRSIFEGARGAGYVGWDERWVDGRGDG